MFYVDEYTVILSSAYKFLMEKVEWNTLLQVKINTENRKRLKEMLTMGHFGETRKMSDKLLYLGIEFKCVQECFAIEA